MFVSQSYLGRFGLLRSVPNTQGSSRWSRQPSVCSTVPLPRIPVSVRRQHSSPNRPEPVGGGVRQDLG